MAIQKSKVTFEITEETGKPVSGAKLELKATDGTAMPAPKAAKEPHVFESELAPGAYVAIVTDAARGVTREMSVRSSAPADRVRLVLPAAAVSLSPVAPREGGAVKLTLVTDPRKEYDVTWTIDPPNVGMLYRHDKADAFFDPPITGKAQTYTATATAVERGGTDRLVVSQPIAVQARGAVGPEAFFEAAKEVALLMKDNLDDRFEELSRHVQATADRISPVGQTLSDRVVGGPGRPLDVRLQRAAAGPTETREEALWIAVRNRTDAIGFNAFDAFVSRVLCNSTDTTGASDSPALQRKLEELPLNVNGMIHGIAAYDVLRTAAQIFLIAECGVVINAPRDPITGGTEPPPAGPMPGEDDRLGRPITFAGARALLTQYLSPTARLPYLQAVVDTLFDRADQTEVSPFCFGLLRTRFSAPCLLELIWSYWHEEGMLVQTINAISRRFQNIRGPAPSDPLSELELDPLRRLNNLLWGYIQDEPHRLTVVRRAYEYNHHYGMKLFGKAVPELRPADTRSKFLEAFHNLLYRTTQFYKQADDTTVVADGFPVLNALKEVHLLLSEGANNQYGDLQWTSRAEMLTQQWLLSRQEFREFLPGRLMVAYPEPWMHRVDSMKRLQGWTDVSVAHFANLARFGEQLLLAIRYGHWSNIFAADTAAGFALYWRQEVQGYVHAYRAVTGVDLTREPVNATVPSVLLRQRLGSEKAASR